MVIEITKLMEHLDMMILIFDRLVEINPEMRVPKAIHMLRDNAANYLKNVSDEINNHPYS